MTCPSPKGICKMFCIGCCDPDTCHELHKEAIHAKEANDLVKVQGILHLRLNGKYIAVIDPNTRCITSLPAELTFEQFEYINRIFTALDGRN